MGRKFTGRQGTWGGQRPVCVLDAEGPLPAGTGPSREGRGLGRPDAGRGCLQRNVAWPLLFPQEGQRQMAAGGLRTRGRPSQPSPRPLVSSSGGTSFSGSWPPSLHQLCAAGASSPRPKETQYWGRGGAGVQGTRLLPDHCAWAFPQPLVTCSSIDGDMCEHTSWGTGGGSAPEKAAGCWVRRGCQ